MAILEREYHAAVVASIYSDEPNRIFDKQSLDLRELWRGRLYVPVTSVLFTEIMFDRRAAKQLTSFRSLEDLTFQECRVEHTAEFPPIIPSGLKSLGLWHTPVTTKNLRRISQLRHLESLTVDGVGLAGDWLRHVSALPKLRELVLINGDVSDGATDSLARMTGLTTLQLSGTKINSKLAPAIAHLERLETLIIDEMPFDDNDVKHLAGLEHLSILFLGGTTITDDGISSLKNLRNLWRLSLDNTKVSDAGLRHLAHLPKLSGLDIRRTQATNSCLRTLAAMPSLEVILVEGTRISRSSPGFHGMLHNGVWRPDATRAGQGKDLQGDLGSDRR